MRRVIQAKRRHFHNTKRSFASQVSLNDAPTQDVLLDDSKESQVRELGEGVKEIELFTTSTWEKWTERAPTSIRCSASMTPSFM